VRYLECYVGRFKLKYVVNRPSASRPVIPKRGEKEFEPAPGGGSGLQLHTLDRARSAMFDTLRATRTINR
jgi:tRNA-splicing endonuclease subunit Sen54